MVDGLLEELDAARALFHEALALVDVDLVTVPGVVNDWSVRDVVVHVAAWDEHGTEALGLAAGGQGELFTYSTDDTDAMNEQILAEGRTLSPADALRREDAAFGAFRDAIATLDAALLSQRLGNGDTVEEVIRYDGPDHYAEHAEHLRAWFTADDADEPLDDD
jgi:hypothetical protein